MGDLSTLVERAAKDMPEQPALFYRPGPDWRWRSWRWLSDRSGSVAHTLREAEPRVGFSPSRFPAGLVASLGIQAAGRFALSTGRDHCEPLLIRARVGSWLALSRDEPLPAVDGLRRFELPDEETPTTPIPEGGVLLPRRGQWEAIPSGALAGGVGELGLPAPRPPARPIVLIESLLQGWPGLRLLAWSVHRRGALVLENDPMALARALWETRPTLALFSSPTLGEIVTALEPIAGSRRGWKKLRRRFQRLAGILVDAPLVEPFQTAFWEEVGVPIQPWSAMDPAA